jgi:hypothetical protein
MPSTINLDSSGLSHAATMTNQNAHLHSASPQSFTSTRVPFSIFLFIGIGLTSIVHSLAVKVQESSTPKVSRRAFALLAFETVTSTTKISSAKTALKATAEMQLSADSNNINNTSSFKDRPSSTFQLVVASVEWISKAVSNKPFKTSRLERIKSKMQPIFKLIFGFKQQYQSQLQQDLVDLSLSNTFSIAKLDYFSIKTKSNSAKLIVASHYSKTFLHFSKGFTIFCEGDQESANNGKDDEAIVWQKSNLPLLLSLALAISTQAALDASVPYNTLAATGHNIVFSPAFGHNMAFGPAFSDSKLIKLIGHIGLGVNFISLRVSFIGLGVRFIDSFVCCVDLSLISLGGHNGDISLICLGLVLSARRLINFIGLGIEGLISKYGFIGLSLVGFIGLGLGSLLYGISLIGLVGLIGFISPVDLVSFGLNGLIGKEIIVNSLQFEIEMKQSQHDLFRRESWLWCVGRVFFSLAGFNSVFKNALQNAKQVFFNRIPQMTKYCIMRECENIHSWISLSGDLVFSHQQSLWF